MGISQRGECGLKFEVMVGKQACSVEREREEERIEEVKGTVEEKQRKLETEGDKISKKVTLIGGVRDGRSEYLGIVREEIKYGMERVKEEIKNERKGIREEWKDWCNRKRWVGISRIR